MHIIPFFYQFESIPPMTKTTIHSFTVGPFMENTWLLEKEGVALLVDPGFTTDSEYERFEKALASGGSQLLAIILTHAHVDHVLGLEAVLRHHSVPVYLNPSDSYLWDHFSQQAALFGFRRSAFSITPLPLVEGDSPNALHPFEFQVLYTPGHSPDHIALYQEQEGFVISGDLLFESSVGRTDLYKGDAALLERSIREKLYRLPDSVRVLPGHGPETTIGREKRENAFVRAE